MGTENLALIDADPMSMKLDMQSDPSYEDKKKAVSVMNVDEYDFLSMAYHGDGYFRNGLFIVPHPREGTYKNRRELSFYKNIFKPVVNSRIDPVFSEPIEREMQDDNGEQIAPPLATKFLEDCDNAETPFGDFMEEAAREGNLESLVFLVVDNFSDQSKSVMENVADRRLPYVYQQNRNTLRGYNLDRFGAIEWIRFYDHSEKEPNGKVTDYYRYWDNEKSILQKSQGTGEALQYIDVEETPHPLGVVPVYPMLFIKKRKKESIDVDYEFYDLARCNWTIYNLDSSTMEAIRDQCFSLLCIQGTKQSDVAIGTKAICWVDPAVNNMPEFISPDPEVARLAGEYAEKIKQSIYEIAEQNGVTAKLNGGVSEQSGKAKEWDFQAHGFILQKITTICKRAELWVMDMFQRYTGEKFIYIPHYKDDYAVTDTNGEIAVQEKVIDNNCGPLAVKLAKKNIARIAFSSNNPEELQAIVEEIDTMADDANISIVKGIVEPLEKVEQVAV